MTQLFKILTVILIVLVTLTGTNGQTQELKNNIGKKIYQEIQEEFRYLEEESAVPFVITASRIKEDIKNCAASITVITDKQIRQMGARHLMDVIRTVPGMSYENFGDGAYKIETRGLGKGGGQDILIMVNSHPLNCNFTGGATYPHDLLSIDNIKQVEIIRGPGSAMYGANAFSGVINVITKQADDINGTFLKASLGSFDTQQYNVLFGNMITDDFGVDVNLNYLTTDGFQPFFKQDYQTIVDTLFSNQSSKAPGRAKSGDEKYDLATTMNYKGLKLDGRFVDRTLEPNLTPLNAINQNGKSDIVDYYVNLSYEGYFLKGFEFLGKVYHNHNNDRDDFQGFSDGVKLLTPYGLYTMNTGPTAELFRKNDRTGIDIQATYIEGESNTLLAGLTYEKIRQYDVHISANYLYTQYPGVIIPLPSIQDITSIQNYNSNTDREFKALFFQDLWDIQENIHLTMGCRYDKYSDFGGSFNPRFGITWGFFKEYNLKLIYGRAFRAPSFIELYTRNNPSVIGNPDLKPETVDTYEVSVGGDITQVVSSRITGFYNTVKDAIGLNILPNSQGGIYENKDRLLSNGFELELTYSIYKGSYLNLNYTYQDSKNKQTKERPYYAPRHKGNLMLNVALHKYINWNIDLHVQDDFRRAKGDIRSQNPGFGIVNSTLLFKPLYAYSSLKELELRLSIYNLLNKNYTFPYPKGTLPGDQPMPDRHFLAEMMYHF
ncbi:MAG: TonB-dependent receptor [Desulfobacterales bacterium]|nr:TonB-dependent receptor [Desulfobacterales bacterium]